MSELEDGDAGVCGISRGLAVSEFRVSRSEILGFGDVWLYDLRV